MPSEPNQKPTGDVVPPVEQSVQTANEPKDKPSQIDAATPEDKPFPDQIAADNAAEPEAANQGGIMEEEKRQINQNETDEPGKGGIFEKLGLESNTRNQILVPGLLIAALALLALTIFFAKASANTGSKLVKVKEQIRRAESAPQSGEPVNTTCLYAWSDWDGCSDSCGDFGSRQRKLPYKETAELRGCEKKWQNTSCNRFPCPKLFRWSVWTGHCTHTVLPDFYEYIFSSANMSTVQPETVIEVADLEAFVKVATCPICDWGAWKRSHDAKPTDFIRIQRLKKKNTTGGEMMVGHADLVADRRWTEDCSKEPAVLLAQWQEWSLTAEACTADFKETQQKTMTRLLKVVHQRVPRGKEFLGVIVPNEIEKASCPICVKHWRCAEKRCADQKVKSFLVTVTPGSGQFENCSDVSEEVVATWTPWMVETEEGVFDGEHCDEYAQTRYRRRRQLTFMDSDFKTNPIYRREEDRSGNDCNSICGSLCKEPVVNETQCGHASCVFEYGCCPTCRTEWRCEVDCRARKNETKFKQMLSRTTTKAPVEEISEEDLPVCVYAVNETECLNNPAKEGYNASDSKDVEELDPTEDCFYYTEVQKHYVTVLHGYPFDDKEACATKTKKPVNACYSEKMWSHCVWYPFNRQEYRMRLLRPPDYNKTRDGEHAYVLEQAPWEGVRDKARDTKRCPQCKWGKIKCKRIDRSEAKGCYNFRCTREILPVSNDTKLPCQVSKVLLYNNFSDDAVWRRVLAPYPSEYCSLHCGELADISCFCNVTHNLPCSRNCTYIHSGGVENGCEAKHLPTKSCGGEEPEPSENCLHIKMVDKPRSMTRTKAAENCYNLGGAGLEDDAGSQALAKFQSAAGRKMLLRMAKAQLFYFPTKPHHRPMILTGARCMRTDNGNQLQWTKYDGNKIIQAPGEGDTQALSLTPALSEYNTGVTLGDRCKQQTTQEQVVVIEAVPGVATRLKEAEIKMGYSLIDPNFLQGQIRGYICYTGYRDVKKKDN